MWANWEVHEWANWLKDYNKNRPVNKRKGFYGLDVYSLWESLDAIMDYIEKEDPETLPAVREAIECFEPHRGEDGQAYAIFTRAIPEGCREEVLELLQKIGENRPEYNSDPEHAFSTEQNALIAKNAEYYYRTMVHGGESTWNIRDQHMMKTLDRLLDFHGEDAKAIVWAHNTHIGDASFTDMGRQGLYNIGELARDEFNRDEVALIGFGSYHGSVLAGQNWGAKVQEMDLPKAKSNSWEDICHEAGQQFFVLSADLKENPVTFEFIPHRAVGVVYHPEREHLGNYVPTVIPQRYDAFVFINETEALHHMDISTKMSKVPETYPFGL